MSRTDRYGNFIRKEDQLLIQFLAREIRKADTRAQQPDAAVANMWRARAIALRQVRQFMYTGGEFPKHATEQTEMMF